MVKPRIQGGSPWVCGRQAGYGLQPSRMERERARYDCRDHTTHRAHAAKMGGGCSLHRAFGCGVTVDVPWLFPPAPQELFSARTSAATIFPPSTLPSKDNTPQYTPPLLAVDTTSTNKKSANLGHNCNRPASDTLLRQVGLCWQCKLCNVTRTRFHGVPDSSHVLHEH